MSADIVFCMEDGGGNNQLCTIDFDGSGFSQLTSDTNGYNWARWSKDGTQILAGDSSNHLWIYTDTGTLVRQLTNIDTGTNLGFWQGDWSPDGTQVVVIGGTVSGAGSSSRCDMQIVNADNSGHSVVTLTEKLALDLNGVISWSPDNTRFLYTGWNGTPAQTNATSCLLNGSSPTDILAATTRFAYVPWRWYSDNTNILVVEGDSVAVSNSLLKSDGSTTTTLYDDTTTDDILGISASLGAMDPTETKFAWNDVTVQFLEGLTAGGAPGVFYTGTGFFSLDGMDWRPSSTPPPPPPPGINAGASSTGIIRLGYRRIA